MVEMTGYKLLIACMAVCSALHGVTGFTGGPPASTQPALVCQQMTPSPGAHGSPQDGDGGYRLEISPPMATAINGFTYETGTAYTIRLVGNGIRGFLVQARLPGNTPGSGVDPMLLGSFLAGNGQQTLDCDLLAGAANDATIAHSQSQADATSVQFTWTAPSTAGNVDFYYTVVRVQATHFDAISASQVGVTNPPTPDPNQANATDPPTNPPATTEPMTTAAPGNTVAPQRSPDAYSLQVVSPNGCTRSNCDLFIGFAINTGDNGFLDIYMEGSAAGWIAVGFSETSDMFLADVVACNRVGEDIVVIDGWNPVPNDRNSQRDTVQDTTLYTSSYNASTGSNGRMTCTVSKRIAPSDAQDLDLSKPLFVIYARRLEPSPNLDTIDTHTSGGAAVRGTTPNRILATNDTGTSEENIFEIVHRPNLIRAHGILMIIAWPLLAVTAIFFALFMRPALPNGEWFKVHRALMVASLVVAVVGFILPFVALMSVADNNKLSIPHLVIGVIITALQITNPIIALFRCKPGNSYRWIFNMLHGYFIGYVLETLAFINISFGLSVFAATLTPRSYGHRDPLWLFVAWCVFEFTLVVVGYITFSVSACYTNDSSCAPSAVQSFISSSDNDRDKYHEIEMTSNGEKVSEEEKPMERKTPSKDSPLRWTALIIYLVVTVPVMIAIIVMIALP